MSAATDNGPDVRPSQRNPRQIASWWHLAGYVVVVALIALLGALSQHAGANHASAANDAQAADQGGHLGFYIASILGDLAFLYYCWVGVHWYGGTFETLTGGRWRSSRQLLKDVAVALPFWLVWEAVALGTWKLLGPSTNTSVAHLLPHSLIDVLVWIVVSIVAGVTEEIQSRGYLQQQLHALSGNVVVAVLGQAVFFGLLHSYQGWKSVIVISVIGVLYGALAAWRKNLRANMIAHAWSDIWEGWLKFVVWK